MATYTTAPDTLDNLVTVKSDYGQLLTYSVYLDGSDELGTQDCRILHGVTVMQIADLFAGHDAAIFEGYRFTVRADVHQAQDDDLSIIPVHRSVEASKIIAWSTWRKDTIKALAAKAA